MSTRQTYGAKKKALFIKIALTIFFLCLSGRGIAQLEYEPYLYEQGFEGTVDPISFWAASGTYTVNEIGFTTEKAFSGNQSYVIDITVNSGRGFNWKIDLSDVPCENILNFSARIWVEQIVGTGSKGGLTTSYSFPPTTITKFRNYGTSQSAEWKLIEKDVVDDAERTLPPTIWGATQDNVGVTLDRIGFSIWASAGDRIRIYIDDIKLEGIVPIAASYDAEIQNRWAPYDTKFNEKMDEYESDKQSANDKIAGLPLDLTPFEEELKAEAQTRIDYIDLNYDFTSIRNRGWLLTDEYKGIEYRLSQSHGIVDGIYMERDGKITREAHLLYNVFPTRITTQDILPDADYIPASINNEIFITATPGEYEPASFAIEAFSDLNGLSVAITDLERSGAGIIPSSDIDIHVVKSWYQNNKDYITYQEGQKVLCPELLLKDDSLIDVDTVNEENYIKLDGEYVWISDPTKVEGKTMVKPTNLEFPVVDSSLLLPVNIPDNKVKQFWLTVKVPAETTVEGEYTGYITFTTPSDGEIGKYKVTVNVLPFELEDSPLKYSLYYRGILTTGGEGTISSEDKSTEQYSNEITNMLKHGVSNPTVYQNIYDLSLLDDALALRANAGMSETSLYYCGLATGNSTDPVELQTLKDNVTDVRNIASNYGITDVYIYGLDEATGDGLLKQREAWEAVHEVGGKIFVAGYNGQLELEYPYGKCGNWHFDEGEGTTAEDFSSYGNDGILVNMDPATSWVAGKIGTALQFDGVDDYVDVGNAASLDITGPLTLEVWINPSGDLISRQGIISKHDFQVGGYSLILLDNDIKLIYNIAGAQKAVSTATDIISQTGIWYHVVGVLDGTYGYIYINGVEVAKELETVPDSTTMSVAIGREIQAGNAFEGIIDEVRIYNRALTADEVYEHYLQGGKVDEGTSGYASASLSGTVTYSQYAGTSALFTFDLREPGTTTIIAEALEDEDSGTPGTQLTVPMSGGLGAYSLSGLPAGIYDVAIKKSNTLREIQPDVSVIAGNDIPNVDFILRGGDANSDNYVSIQDYAILRSAYGSTAGDSRWDERADFNGDGYVSIQDYAILRANYL